MFSSRPKFFWSLFVGAAMAVALAGCGSDSPTSPSTPSDEQILTSIVTGGSADSSRAMRGRRVGGTPPRPRELARVVVGRDPVRGPPPADGGGVGTTNRETTFASRQLSYLTTTMSVSPERT